MDDVRAIGSIVGLGLGGVCALEMDLGVALCLIFCVVGAAAGRAAISLLAEHD